MAPEIVEAIVNGRQMPDLQLGALMQSFPMDRLEQRAKFRS